MKNTYDENHKSTTSGLWEKITNHIKTLTSKPFLCEDETQSGEYYIDSFGVSPLHQGKGIGTRMLEHLIQEHTIKQGITLGLLVDKENTAARRLYQRLGFEKW